MFDLPSTGELIGIALIVIGLPALLIGCAIGHWVF